MSRLPKFGGSRIPPFNGGSKSEDTQTKEPVFKAPVSRLYPAKSIALLNKISLLDPTNVPKVMTEMKMARRSKSAAELRRPLGPHRAPNTNASSRPTATVSAAVHPAKKPIKRIGAPVVNPVKQKLAKPSPPKATRPKTVPKPAPYDYKARFGLLKDSHDNLKVAHATLKENLKQLSDENEMLTPTIELLRTENNNSKSELTIIQTELRDLKTKFEMKSSSYDMLATELKQNHNLIIDLKQLLHDLDAQKRKIHNEMQDLKGNIRVFCRIRPALNEEQCKPLCNISYVDEKTLEISKGKESVEPTGRSKLNKVEFSFDHVFSTNSSQEEVFHEVAQLVQSALDGYNVCVFAYGQTGSGKTYTMEGDVNASESLGMIPRAIDLIFKSLEPLQQLGWSYNITASFLEIYNETIVDLLNPGQFQHEIRMSDSKCTDVYVTKLTIPTIHSASELKNYMQLAQRNRAVAATENNERSSRSHSVTKIVLQGISHERNVKCSGSLNLIDLAGSERIHATTANARINETKNINKSLASLGNVILALHKKLDHVPYRDTKLTHLLMPCLGGNSKTLMLVNIAPFEECYNETMNSLRFATSVNQCKTGAIKRNKTACAKTGCAQKCGIQEFNMGFIKCAEIGYIGTF